MTRISPTYPGRRRAGRGLAVLAGVLGCAAGATAPPPPRDVDAVSGATPEYDGAHVPIVDFDDIERFRAYTKKTAAFVDARFEAHIDGGKLPGAVFLNTKSTDEEVARWLPDTNQLVVVYCSHRTCPAGYWMAQRLARMGYKRICEYTGGIDDWRRRGGVVESAGEPQGVIHVRDFGALPDDHRCDAGMINAAFAEARRIHATRIEFDAGTYNLSDVPLGPGVKGTAILELRQASNLELAGATDPDGNPATRLERNVDMANDLDLRKVILLDSCTNVTFRNFVIDNDPEFSSAGEVVSVDAAADRVEVDVFEGLMHFDGMKCYSANAWDLKTRRLLPVPALTIGVNTKAISNPWRSVPGGEGRRYRIEGLEFSDRVRPGQAISWHVSVDNRGGQMYAMRCENLRLENVRFPNSHMMVFLAGYCKNLSLVNVRVEPEGNAYAVGSRDAFHLSCGSGTLLVEGCVVRGVRWDPFNIKARFAEVTRVAGAREIDYAAITINKDVPAAGDRVVFWHGDEPVERTVEMAEFTGRLNSAGAQGRELILSGGTLRFIEPLPEGVRPGTFFTPLSWTYSEAVIRNTLIADNCGRAIVYQSENLRVEDCVFRNNAYASIALGPIMYLEGGFARNIVIRGNTFSDSTWDVSGGLLGGTISMFQKGEYRSLHNPKGGCFATFPTTETSLSRTTGLRTSPIRAPWPFRSETRGMSRFPAIAMSIARRGSMWIRIAQSGSS